MSNKRVFSSNGRFLTSQNKVLTSAFSARFAGSLRGWWNADNVTYANTAGTGTVTIVAGSQEIVISGGTFSGGNLYDLIGINTSVGVVYTNILLWINSTRVIVNKIMPTSEANIAYYFPKAASVLDISGNGNHFTQATDGSRARIKMIRGQNGLVFTHSPTTNYTCSTINIGNFSQTGDSSFAIVGQRGVTNGTSSIFLFAMYGGSNNHLNFNIQNGNAYSGGVSGNGVGGGSSVIYPEEEFYCMYTKDAVDRKLYKNKIEVGTGAIVVPTISGTGSLRLGTNSFDYGSKNIQEILLYNKALSYDERQIVDDYVGEKYKF
jgi:hypothetical protein